MQCKRVSVQVAQPEAEVESSRRRTKDRNRDEMCRVQVLKIGEQSNRRGNGSRELIGVHEATRNERIVDIGVCVSLNQSTLRSHKECHSVSHTRVHFGDASSGTRNESPRVCARIADEPVGIVSPVDTGSGSIQVDQRRNCRKPSKSA